MGVSLRRFEEEDRSWITSAACRGMPPDLFFASLAIDNDPRRDHHKSSAAYDDGRKVCARCPVRRQCLESSLRIPFEDYGLWGGQGPRERRRERGRRYHQQEEQEWRTA